MDHVKGLDGVLRTLEKHIEAVVKSQGAALYMAANDVMTLAKEHTPLKIGPLQNSGYVSEPEKVGSKVVVEMGFGGVAEDYAIRQHEDMDLIHPNPDRGAKFLENAMDAKRAQIMEDLPLLLKVALMSGNAVAPERIHPSSPGQGAGKVARAGKRIRRAIKRVFKSPRRRRK